VQPTDQGRGSAIVEQVNGPVRFKVEQQRPVPALFLSQRDVIDTSSLGPCCPLWSPAHAAGEATNVADGRTPASARQASASFAGSFE